MSKVSDKEKYGGLTSPANSMQKPIKCKNCGHVIKEHYGVNLSDGQFVSKEVLVCPTSIWKP